LHQVKNDTKRTKLQIALLNLTPSDSLLFASVAAICLPFVIVNLSIYLHLDPFYIILREDFPTSKKRVTLTLSRLILELCRWYFVPLCVFGAVWLLFLICVCFISMIRVLLHTFQLLNEQLERHVWFRVNISRYIVCYDSFIICLNKRQYVVIVALFFMGMGMLMLALFNFVTIRLL